MRHERISRETTVFSSETSYVIQYFTYEVSEYKVTNGQGGCMYVGTAQGLTMSTASDADPHPRGGRRSPAVASRT